MYRLDPGAEPAAGFTFPPNDKPYFTGRGGLHFWFNLDDAIAYVNHNSENRFYACPQVQVGVEVEWQREWMSAAYAPSHTVPTLVLGVQGYCRASQ